MLSTFVRAARNPQLLTRFSPQSRLIRNSLIESSLVQRQGFQGQFQARELSFFADLKKKFQQQTDDNPELKESVENLKKEAQKLSQRAESLKNTASEKYESSESVKKGEESLRSAASKSQEAFRSTGEKVKQAYEDASSKVHEQAQKASENSEYAKQGREAAQGVTSFFGGIRAKVATNKHVQWVSENTAHLREGWGEAAKELLGDTKPRDINRVTVGSAPDMQPAQAKEGEEEEDEEKDSDKEPGVTALQVVKSRGSAWEQVAARLKNTPIIQGILGATRQVADSDVGRGAAKVKQSLDDRVEDVREVWETSQNPLVYTVSSIVDSVFSETETGVALRELRRLDPTFTLEEWKEDVRLTVLPDVMECFLKGDSIGLKRWLSEGAHSVVAAAIRQRKSDGLVMDPQILAIRGVEVLAAKAEDKQLPIVVLQFMVQQINCIRNREGEIVEGNDDEIRAVYYAFAFQRDYDETSRSLQWRVVEFSMMGAVPYV